VSKGETEFYEEWRAGVFAAGFPLPEREYPFHPTRMWRADFAWPQIKLLVEIEGRGRHQSFVGYKTDCEKYNEAVRLGWRVLRFPASDWKKAGEWVAFVVDCMCTSPEV
jgi:very-short-patch-repair endonuclease